MNKRVYNKTIGKIFRTLGFLLMLLVSVILASELVVASNIPFLQSVEPIATQITGLIPTAVNGYFGLGMLAGLLFLVWAIRRGFVLRVLVTVLLVVVFLLESYTANAFFTGYVLTSPSWLGSVVNLVSGPIDQLLAISGWVAPGVTLFAVILLWGVFANARPKRFSIFFIRLATLTLFLGVVLMALEVNLTSAFVSSSGFLTVKYLSYIASFALISVGSLLGVIGFYRK